MDLLKKKQEYALKKELLRIEKQERKMESAAQKNRSAGWKMQLESKIPKKVYDGLESAFCKGFSIVFAQGRQIIEKSYKKEERKADYSIRNYAVQVKGGRRELRQMNKSAGQSNLFNAVVTTAEGIGLGALGIGMPDIVLFLGILLKGVYETALNYGFDYESKREQILILKMMEAALSSGEDWSSKNAQVDAMMERMSEIQIWEEVFDEQVKETASAFAVDMLLLKFIQGLPVVGIIGGAANPVYYNKVMKYVQLKYQKRYLLRQKAKENGECNG